MDIEYIIGAIAIVVFVIICLAYNHYTFSFLEKSGIGIVKLAKKKNSVVFKALHDTLNKWI